MSGAFNVLGTARLHFPLIVVVSTILVVMNMNFVWMFTQIALVALCLVVCYASWIGFKMNFGKNSEWMLNLVFLVVSLVCVYALVIALIDGCCLYFGKRV